MKSLPHALRHRGLEGIMIPLAAARLDESQPLEYPVNVRVHGKGWAPQGVCQYTPGALRSDPGKGRQELLSVRVCHRAEKLKREVTRLRRCRPHTALGVSRGNRGKQSLELACALPL